MGAFNMTKNLTFSEVMEHGKDKQVFIVVQSGREGAIGKKVIMKQTKYGMVMKEYGCYSDNNKDTIVVPTSDITGAFFDLEVKYEKISLSETVSRIENHKTIFTYIEDEGFSRVSTYLDFKEIGVYDFEDLLLIQFYKQAN